MRSERQGPFGGRYIVRPPREEGALERLERLTGDSLDRIEEYLSIPLQQVLGYKQYASIMTSQVQYVRAVLATMVKLGLESSRLTVEREKIVADLMRREFPGEFDE